MLDVVVMVILILGFRSGKCRGLRNLIFFLELWVLVVCMVSGSRLVVGFCFGYVFF